ncbi:MAG: DUF6600 domain-containing protein [Telluria sp.]
MNTMLRSFAAAAFLLAAGLAQAQIDPPTRVARLGYATGPVSFAPAGLDTWYQPDVNRPLVPGDRIWADRGGRGELQFGPAIARLDGGTLASIENTDDGATQLRLTQGRVRLHVRRLAPGEVVEVDTPDVAFVADQPGDYRIEVDPSGNTAVVSTLRGHGEAWGDRVVYDVGPGQAMRFGQQGQYGLEELPPPDDLDRWAMNRDLRLDRVRAVRYVSPEVPGVEALDDYGDWRTVPQYGTVWMPTRAPANWAPYHDGHWAWIDPWGWTWVDQQPFGFATSHYGRWAHVEDRWAWVPAPVQQSAAPVYAPALVAFVGALLADRQRDPGVGWFPLAPNEPYRPTYRASPQYVQRVNVTNTNITNISNVVNNINNITNINYANRQVPGAMVAMPTASFGQAQQVSRSMVAVPRQLAAAAPVLAALPAAPREVRPMARIASQRPPAAAVSRPVVAVTQPRMLALAAAGQAPHAAPPPVRMLAPPPNRALPGARIPPGIANRAPVQLQSAPGREVRVPTPALPPQQQQQQARAVPAVPPSNPGHEVRVPTPVLPPHAQAQAHATPAVPPSNPGHEVRVPAPVLPPNQQARAMPAVPPPHPGHEGRPAVPAAPAPQQQARAVPAVPPSNPGHEVRVPGPVMPPHPQQQARATPPSPPAPPAHAAAAAAAPHPQEARAEPPMPKSNPGHEVRVPTPQYHPQPAVAAHPAPAPHGEAVGRSNAQHTQAGGPEHKPEPKKAPPKHGEPQKEKKEG